MGITGARPTLESPDPPASLPTTCTHIHPQASSHTETCLHMHTCTGRPHTCIHIHTETHGLTQSHSPMPASSHYHTYMPSHIQAHTHTHTQRCVKIYTETHLLTYTSICMREPTDVPMCTLTLSHIDTHSHIAHAGTHMYMHVRMCGHYSHA